MLVIPRPSSRAHCVKMFPRCNGASACLWVPCPLWQSPGSARSGTSGFPRPGKPGRFCGYSPTMNRFRIVTTLRGRRRPTCEITGIRALPERTEVILISAFEVFMRHIRMKPAPVDRTECPSLPIGRADRGPSERHWVFGDFTYRPLPSPPAGDAIGRRTRPTCPNRCATQADRWLKHRSCNICHFGRPQPCFCPVNSWHRHCL